MKFPFFASIIIGSLLLMLTIRLLRRKEHNLTKKYLEREALANSARAQSLDTLNYISIPERFFQFFEESVPESAQEALLALLQLKDAPIVNLSGISNTDLKFSYGAANLETLSLYDQNYTIMARSIQTLAEAEYACGHIDQSSELLEFLITTHCDMMRTYRLLSSIYIAEGNAAKTDYLISSASTLPGLTREPIMKMLTSMRPSDNTDEESILRILE